MKAVLKKIIRFISLPFVLADLIKFNKHQDQRFSLSLMDIYPCIKDKTIETNFDRHYVYHTAWAARKVRDFAPERHVDIASSLYFSGIVSAFIPVDFYDYRPASLQLSNLKTNHADLTTLHFSDNSIQSLSCLHTIEHIGLGRYGDPIDPKGDIRAARELTRVLSPGGQLLFVTPVGNKARIQFNAHRIYTYEKACALFPDLELVEFSYIPERDSSGIIEYANPKQLRTEAYACGCFVFKKPIA